MPISYRIDVVGGIVHVAFTGQVTVAEFHAHRARLTSDPEFRASMHRLTDVRGLTALPTMNELRELALLTTAARRREPPHVRRGVIVGTRAGYGVIRQYQAFVADAGYAVDLLSSDEEVAGWLAALRVEDGTPDV